MGGDVILRALRTSVEQVPRLDAFVINVSIVESF